MLDRLDVVQYVRTLPAQILRLYSNRRQALPHCIHIFSAELRGKDRIIRDRHPKSRPELVKRPERFPSELCRNLTRDACSIPVTILS